MIDTKEYVLDEAKKVVMGARADTYGGVEDNFARIARYWNVRLENTGRAPNLTPADVAVFMQLLKRARLDSSPKHLDSIVDSIGYDACYASIVLGKDPSL